MLNNTLFRIGKSPLTWNHLLIIGILALSFSISFLLRIAPAEYGYELNEFDPFFNYRATSFLVENGYGAYLDWHDDRSWYPTGRDISATSQSMLHITASVTYLLFGGAMDLYDFTIIFPVVFGSLTTVLIFALVRVIGGTASGLLAALFFSVSLPILVRGMVGWFKSEPLGLFYGVLSVYLFISGIKSPNRKVSLLKLVGAGVFLSFGLSSWGGIQFFILPLGVFFLALPFLRDDHRFQLWAVPVFTATLLSTTLLFERPGANFVTGFGGFAILGPTVFLVACNLIRMFSKKEKALRNSLFFLAGVLVSGFAIISVSFSSGLLPIPSFRYLNAINPFLTSSNALVDSVSEHATTTLAQSFYLHSVLMVFAGIAVWYILQNKGAISPKKYDVYGFALIMGIFGVYVSSAFIRLELFASISLIVLSSIGISMLLSRMFETRAAGKKPLAKKPVTQIMFSVGIASLLLIPLTVPAEGNWSNAVGGIPPTILNGATSYPLVSSDWPATLSWMQSSTPEDSVIAAWWDYGYWITAMGQRTSIVDNATSGPKQIKNMANILIGNPDDSWKKLQELDADYILVFVAAEKVASGGDLDLYTLRGGGDESKKSWFIKIAGESLPKYLHSDGLSGTPYFWNNTLLGKLSPYSIFAYFDQRTNLQHEEFTPGSIPLYVKDVKYPEDGDGPFKLAYASPGYLDGDQRYSLGVFVYEINKDYVLPTE